MPTLAVVVINYNYAKYVGDALASIAAQLEPFDEVLVVDDGSTDDSRAIVAERFPDVTVIAKQNGGQLSAVWAAVAATTCDYLCVLDADDEVLPPLVQMVRPLLADGVVKLQYQLETISSDGSPSESFFPSYRAGYDSAAMQVDNQRLGFYICAPTSGNIFQTDYLRRLAATALLNERDFVDGVPAQLAPYFGEVVSLNVPLARYRVHAESDSQWGAPTPQLLKRESTQFRSRWRQSEAVLAVEGRQLVAPTRPAYLLERALILAILDGRRPQLGLSLRFAGRIVGSKMPPRQRVILALWAVALAIAPRKLAEELAIARRSPGKRSGTLTRIARMARVSRVVG